MARLSLEKYFDGMDNKYYDSSFLISILEKILEKDFSEIKDEVNNSQISVTADEIFEFLEKTFQEEEPELKERIENPRPRCNKPIGEWNEQDVKNNSQRFGDKISAARYRFEPYTLEYFNRYITIVKSKALQLLNIIELIGTKQSITIQDLLTELDIQLDKNGNIIREDIIRLITPAVQNITVLNEKVTKANELSTYLTFKMSKHSLYRNGFSEKEIYPTSSILDKGWHYEYSYGNVPISSRQKQELDETYKQNLKKGTKQLLKLY